MNDGTRTTRGVMRPPRPVNSASVARRLLVARAALLVLGRSGFSVSGSARGPVFLGLGLGLRRLRLRFRLGRRLLLGGGGRVAVGLRLRRHQSRTPAERERAATTSDSDERPTGLARTNAAIMVSAEVDDDREAMDTR